MPKDMFLPKAYPIKLKITPDGDKFKCVIKLGDSSKSPPIYGKTAADALAIVALHLVDNQIGAEMMDDFADLLHAGEDKAGSRE